MKTIVTGRFEAEDQAARAVDRLLRACVPGHHVHAYLLSPHALVRDSAAGHLEAWESRLHDEKAAASAAIELALGPAAADGMKLSAYIASVPHAAQSGSRDRPAPTPAEEILVAVETHDQVSQALAINVLRRHGAQAVKRSAPGQPVAHRSDIQPLSLSALLARSDNRTRSGAVPPASPRKFH